VPCLNRKLRTKDERPGEEQIALFHPSRSKEAARAFVIAYSELSQNSA